MVDEMKTLRDTTMGEWKVVLKQAQTNSVQFLGNIGKIEKEIMARAQEMHKEVDAILLRSQQTLNEMKESGLGKLKDQEKYIADRLQQLQDEVQRYEDQLRDADPHALLQFEQGKYQGKDKTMPPALEAPIPVFTKGQNDINAMQNMFGQLSSKTIRKSGEILEKSNFDTATTATSGQTKEPSPRSSATQRSLISKPSVQSEFSMDLHYPHIACVACVNQGQAWVYTKDNMLQLVDRDGTKRDTINTDFDINTMTITADGELLLSDYNKKRIKSVSREKEITTLFRTSWTPCGLCCLHNGDIVVTFPRDRKVVVYGRNGKIRQKMDNIKFRHPWSVAVNKVNQDKYICDHEQVSHPTTGKVVAVRADGQLRYEYRGQGGKKLVPFVVCTDEMGNVLVSDLDNDRVHILDQEGQFIQYVLTSQQGLDQPATIDVDREGYVWVGERYNKCVKVARYLE